jgi:hypothetical protein
VIESHQRQARNIEAAAPRLPRPRLDAVVRVEAHDTTAADDQQKRYVGRLTEACA